MLELVGSLLDAFPKSPPSFFAIAITIGGISLISNNVGSGYVRRTNALLDLLPKLEACGLTREYGVVKRKISRLTRYSQVTTKLIDDAIETFTGPLKMTGFLLTYALTCCLYDVTKILLSGDEPIFGPDYSLTWVLSVAAMALVGVLLDIPVKRLFWSGFNCLVGFGKRVKERLSDLS